MRDGSFMQGADGNKTGGGHILKKKGFVHGKYVLSITLCGVGLAAAAVIIGLIIHFSMDYRKADQLYERTAAEYVILPERERNETGEQAVTGEGQNSEDGAQSSTMAAADGDWWKLMRVDLGRLSRNFPDVVGWIAFENENISYPVVYSGDNTKYLRTAYTGAYANAGSIFLEGQNTPDFSDPHTLIYGHNMHDLSMFGKLKYYISQEGYLEEHQYFQIFTVDKVYRYQVFAAEEVSETSGIYDVKEAKEHGIRDLANTLIKGAYYKTDLSVGTGDLIITLSTCTADDEKRLIVSAVRVDEYSVNQ